VLVGRLYRPALKAVRSNAAAGRLRAVLALPVGPLGRAVPGPEVHPGDAVAHRTDAEGSPHAAAAPFLVVELLVQGPRADLWGCRRGPQQQGQTDYQKGVGFPIAA
jgi:hypothetical protein